MVLGGFQSFLMVLGGVQLFLMVFPGLGLYTFPNLPNFVFLDFFRQPVFLRHRHMDVLMPS